MIYYYAGTHVASPALDSASPIVRKIAYGMALPTIVIAGVVNGHVGVKYLYVRLFRNNENDVMHQKTARAYGSWVLICAVLWIVAWIIAEGVPVFNDLLGLTSALFASWFTFGLSGMFWLHMNKGKWFQGWKKVVLFVINVINVLIGLSIVSFVPDSHISFGFANDMSSSMQCVIGLYASGKSISINTVHTKPFSCVG